MCDTGDAIFISEVRKMAQTEKDWYLENIVGLGDDISAVVEAKCATTLRNSDHVDVVREGMNGIKVIRIPEGNYAAAYMVTGDKRVIDPASHAASLVRNMAERAEQFGNYIKQSGNDSGIDLQPIAFADVLDFGEVDASIAASAADALVQAANEKKLAIVNGETALLGRRVVHGLNINGTMIAAVPKQQIEPGVYHQDFGTLIVFDTQAMPVYMNSDGVGTKTEFRERLGTAFHPALNDSAAMKLDDDAKIGAQVQAMFDTVEMKGDIPFARLVKHAQSLGRWLKLTYVLHGEQADYRLMGYSPEAPAYNISGSAVAIVPETRLRNPLKPNVGDTVIALRDVPNPRSNGITSLRKSMERIFGTYWHEDKEGKKMLQYLIQSSTILYPVFMDLIKKSLATFVTHMSGGAYDGKFAKPLAKHHLYAALENLFKPDWRTYFFTGADFISARTAYAKWPMGNDGFITTAEPQAAITVIQHHGLEARIVGKIEQAQGAGLHERTGIELVGIKDLDGKTNVYYSGRKEK